MTVETLHKLSVCQEQGFNGIIVEDTLVIPGYPIISGEEEAARFLDGWVHGMLTGLHFAANLFRKARDDGHPESPGDMGRTEGEHHQAG